MLAHQRQVAPTVKAIVEETVARAMEARQSGDCSTALACFDRAIASDQSDAHLRLNRAVLLLEMNLVEQAEADLEVFGRLVQGGGDQGTCLFAQLVWAVCHFQQGRMFQTLQLSNSLIQGQQEQLQKQKQQQQPDSNSYVDAPWWPRVLELHAKATAVLNERRQVNRLVFTSTLGMMEYVKSGQVICSGCHKPQTLAAAQLRLMTAPPTCDDCRVVDVRSGTPWDVQVKRQNDGEWSDAYELAHIGQLKGSTTHFHQCNATCISAQDDQDQTRFCGWFDLFSDGIGVIAYYPPDCHSIRRLFMYTDRSTIDVAQLTHGTPVTFLCYTNSRGVSTAQDVSLASPYAFVMCTHATERCFRGTYEAETHQIRFRGQDIDINCWNTVPVAAGHEITMDVQVAFVIVNGFAHIVQQLAQKEPIGYDEDMDQRLTTTVMPSPPLALASREHGIIAKWLSENHGIIEWTRQSSGQVCPLLFRYSQSSKDHPCEGQHVSFTVVTGAPDRQFAAGIEMVEDPNRKRASFLGWQPADRAGKIHWGWLQHPGTLRKLPFHVRALVPPLSRTSAELCVGATCSYKLTKERGEYPQEIRLECV